MTITGTTKTTTVSGMAKALEQQLQNPGSLGAISTRVLLRTGVNLRKPTPQQDTDGTCVEKVRTALSDMGFAI
jgi:hypothetical protein